MNSILVDPMGTGQDGEGERKPLSREDQLVSWVMSRVDQWRDYRDNSFKDSWDEYYRLWRGRWHVKDKSRKSERSKIVTPALSQAIDSTVAELQMAVFSNTRWFDLDDDYGDEAPQDIQKVRDALHEDLEFVNSADAISESFLNGALYGTMIAKIITIDDRITSFERNSAGNLIPVKKGQVFFGLEPIEPGDLVVDPSGRNIDEMLGVAHEISKPMNAVQRLQNNDTYRKVSLFPHNPDEDRGMGRMDLEQSINGEDTVLITEWHGLVPARLLPTAADQRGEKNEIDSVLDRQAQESGDETLVEAIVTIANKGVLLRAIKNPFPGGDRSVVAAQFEKVPGRFNGRGVAEKGFNPQKALDAEVRMRIDALALVSNPMMGADVTRLPRGFDFTTRPGKVWLTQGAPKDVLHPVQFSQLDPNTFNQTSEMERMVQMGTGAFEVAAPLKENRRNETASGSSMILGAFVKRSKLVLHNIERNFLRPLLRKLTWRYMQYAPERYPVDARFKIASTMGIMARELEQSQLIQLMGLVEQNSAPFMTMLKSLITNTSVTNKAEIMGAIDRMLNPPQEVVEKQRQMEELQLLGLQLELGEKESKLRENLASEILKKAQAQLALVNAQVEGAGVSLDMAKLQKEFEQLEVELREVMAFERQVDVQELKVRLDARKVSKTGGDKK